MCESYKHREVGISYGLSKEENLLWRVYVLSGLEGRSCWLSKILPLQSMFCKFSTSPPNSDFPKLWILISFHPSSDFLKFWYLLSSSIQTNLCFHFSIPFFFQISNFFSFFAFFHFLLIKQIHYTNKLKIITIKQK